MIVTNHLIKKLLFILFLFFISNSAVAEWTLMGEGENGVIRFSQYANLSTIRESGNIVKMWSLTDHKFKQKLPSNVKYLSYTSHNEYDCQEELFRVNFILFYDGNMGNGQLVGTISNHDEKLSGGTINPENGKMRYEQIDTIIPPFFRWTPIPPREGPLKSFWSVACGKLDSIPHISSEGVKWLKVKVSKSGDVFYFEPDTIDKDGQYREVWNLIDLKQKDSDGIHSSVMRIKYDCKNEKWRGLDMLSYSGSMGSGRILDSTLGGSEWMPVRRDSSLDTMLDIVCDKRG